jgi:tRNA isopentenyl-2-thiomethyl-A-37 hydroxylase MiaE
MPVRPLLSRPDRVACSLPIGWMSTLRADQPETVLVDHEASEVLRGQVAVFVDGIRIARHSVDIKAVQEQLDKIMRRAQNAIAAKSPEQATIWTCKLKDALKPPSNLTIVSERALHRS